MGMKVCVFSPSLYSLPWLRFLCAKARLPSSSGHLAGSSPPPPHCRHATSQPSFIHDCGDSSQTFPSHENSVLLDDASEAPPLSALRGLCPPPCVLHIRSHRPLSSSLPGTKVGHPTPHHHLLPSEAFPTTSRENGSSDVRTALASCYQTARCRQGSPSLFLPF